jgi:hypothetical protein
MFKVVLTVPILLLAATTMTIPAFAQQQPGWNEGWQAGLAQAQYDFKAGTGYADKCDDHGYGDQSPGICLGFKAAYVVEWNVMNLAH